MDLNLRALKGPPVSILMALWIASPHPLSNQQLSTATGYSDKPIAAGLRVLQAANIAETSGRYAGWHLTLTTRQMFLGENLDTDALDHQTESFRLTSSSSSSFNFPSLQSKPPQQPQAETEKIRLDPEWTITRDSLIQHICIPPQRADLICQAAIDRAELPAQLLYHAYRTLSFAQARDTINNEIWYTIRQLEAGTPSPPWYTPHRTDRLWPRITAAKRLWAEQETNRAQSIQY